VESYWSTNKNDVSILAGKEATSDNFRTVFQEMEQDIPEDFRVRHESSDDTFNVEDDDAGEEEEDDGEEEGEGDDEDGGGSDDSSQKSTSSASSQPPYDHPKRKVTWQEHLARCRALHLCCVMMSNPYQGLQLAKAKHHHNADKINGHHEQSETAAQGCFTAKDILHNLYLKHCGLVTLSRAGVCDSIPSLNLYRNTGFSPYEFTDAFICAGALSVVQPLWTIVDDQGLATILIMGKMYNLLLDVAHHERPLAAALRKSQCWLRNITFQGIRNEITQMRMAHDIREGLNGYVWQMASKIHSSDKANKPLQPGGFENNPFLLQLKPFTSLYYWSAFRAHGACTGIHRSSLANVSDDEDDDTIASTHKKKTDWEDSGINADRDRLHRGAKKKVEKMARELDKGLDFIEEKVKAKVKVVKEAVRVTGDTRVEPVLDYEGRKKEMEEIFAMAEAPAAPPPKEEKKPDGKNQHKRWRGPEAIARVNATIEKKRADKRRVEVEELISQSCNTTTTATGGFDSPTG